MLRIFISHLAVKRKFATELKSSFSKFLISSFVAHDDIEPTREWQDEIEGALASCDVLVALLHPEFHTSNWTDQEIGFALGRGVPTFAVQLGTDPYGFIGRFFWDKQYSERIENAVKANNQISESWGVEERAEALVKKWSMVPA